MEARHDRIVKNVENKHSNELQSSDSKLEKVKKRLVNVQNNVVADRAKWQLKLDELNVNLSELSDQLYLQKKRTRDAVATQLLLSQRKEAKLQNYIDGLENMNSELAAEWKEASDMRKLAEGQSRRLQKLAKQRLQNWHDEMAKRKKAEDTAAEQSQLASKTKVLLDEYKEMLAAADAKKIEMKK